MSPNLAPSATTVPLLDVSRDNAPLRDAVLAALARVWESGRFLHGPEVAELERRIASLCGVPHAVACASGSDALLLALMALQIGPGDEVIVPSFTFFATASAVSRLGAKIVFVDIDPLTFNLDPQAVAAAITPRTKAVIPVHLFGQCARVDMLGTIAERHGVHLVEDAAQALGARLFGRPACSWGEIGCLSFYPTKNLGGMGDGGMLTTRDGDLAQRLRLLAAHGMSPRYYHQVIGINSRLDTVQAAVLLVKLDQLDQWTRRRQQHAAAYGELMRAAGLTEHVVLPKVAEGCEHVWNQYSIRVTNGHRPALREFLTARGIGTEVYYPLPLHLQACFQNLGYVRGSLPVTEQVADEILNLPIFPGLHRYEQQAIVDSMVAFFAARQSVAA